MMYTMPKNLLSICVNFTLATQQFRDSSKKDFTAAEGCGMLIISVCRISWGRTTGPQACIIFYLIMLKKGR